MAYVVKFNPAHDDVILNSESQDTSQFLGDPDAVINPNLSAVANVAQRYWKFTALNPPIQPMTQAERDAKDAAETAAFLAANQNAAKSKMTASDGIDFRALAAILVDEINVLRARDRDRAQDVADSISLADLKVRWALRAILTDRTLAQAKTSYLTKVDSGAAN